MSDVMKREVHCTTAADFLDELSPVGKNFQDDNLKSKWLFRGQGRDKNWSLTPSLFRENALKSLTTRNTKDFLQLLLAEKDIFIDFFEIVDKRGLAIPDDSRVLRSYLESIRLLNYMSGSELEKGIGFIAKNEECLSLMALAQHYGIPTRLLDWTRRSLIATFFAAEGGVKTLKEFPEERIVVWALYYPTLGTKISRTAENFSIRVIRAPSFTNPNLAAQQGVFTLVHPRHTNESSGEYRPLEEILWEPDKMNFRKDAESCELRKFTLPTSQSLELLRLLAKLDITFSSVYPGYHSIINDLKVQASLTVADF